MNDNKAEFKKDIKERLLSAHRKRYASALARSPMIKVVLYGLDSISWAVASRPKAERAAEKFDSKREEQHKTIECKFVNQQR